MTTTEDNEKKYSEELAKLNELFAKRYTDEDEEYIKMTKHRSNTPPIVDDWSQQGRSNRGRQQYNNNNQRRHFSNDRQQYGNHSNHHQYSNDHRQDRNYSNDNRRDRDRSRSPPYRDQRR
jgi:RNMT-activating mini protein